MFFLKKKSEIFESVKTSIYRHLINKLIRPLNKLFSKQLFYGDSTSKTLIDICAFRSQSEFCYR